MCIICLVDYLLACFGKFCLTALSMAVRVRSVVMPMATLPGTDSGSMNRENQASTTNMADWRYIWRMWYPTLE